MCRERCTGSHSEQAVAYPDSYPDHYAWIWLAPYVRTLWRNRGNRAVRRELVSLARNLRNIKVDAYLDWRDPMPFVMGLARSSSSKIGRQARTLIGRSRLPATDAP